MNLGNLGFTELLMILVIVLVLFGARRVPEIGASIGRGIREFKKNISDVDREVREPLRESRPGDRLGRSDVVGAQRGRGRASGAEATDLDSANGAGNGERVRGTVSGESQKTEAGGARA
jgi:TatA/E family protein of Tat protein translocase